MSTRSVTNRLIAGARGCFPPLGILGRRYRITIAVALGAVALASADAHAQTVFRETFGSTNGQLPTATSTADGNWTNSACLNGQILSGSSPSDAGTGSTHGLFHNTASCAYTSNQAVWRNVTPIAVQPFTAYTFSYWVRLNHPSNPPILNQLVSTNAGGSVTVVSNDAPALVVSTWVRRSQTFTTGAGTTGVTLRIRNTQTTGAGNDFWLDDIVLAQIPPFPGCEPTPYLAQGSPSTLYRVSTGTNPFTFSPVGVNATAPFLYNAAGFNPADNYIYVIENGTNVMTRVASDGTVIEIGAITGLPVGGYPAGVIAPDGFWYVTAGVAATTIYRIDIATRQATTINITSGSPNIGGDLASYNGELYTAAFNVLQKITFTGPTTATISNVGTYIGPTGFGAMLGASNGVFGIANSGGFYQFDPVTGAATEISSTPFSVGNNDGVKCEAAPFVFASDLRVTKTDNSPTYMPGQNVVYTIVASNTGPFGVANAIVDDPLPAGITTASWTCANGANGGTCGAASGVGGISNALVNLPVNANVTFTLTMAVPPGFTGALANTVTITGPSTTLDTNTANNTATDTDIVATADLAISKVSSPNPYQPNQPFTYTIVVANLGPDPAVNAIVNDPFPPALSLFNWACAASTGAACGVASGGPGAISAVPVSLQPGSTVTFTVTGIVPIGTSGPLVNTATVTAPPTVVDPVPGNNTATDVNPTTTLADLRVTKASTPNPFVPGAPLTYTIVYTNAGPANVLGARLQDALPVAFAGFTWTCVATGGATPCPPTPTTGDIDVFVDMPVGSGITFTVSGTVPSTYASTATNTATITPPPGITDPVPGNNTSTTSNPPGPIADLSIVKAQTPNPHVPGGVISYSLVVSNAGPSAVTNARVQDVVPAEVTGVTWTCTTGPGGTCSTTAVNPGNLVDAFVSLPVGTTATFFILGIVSPTPSVVLSNTGTVAPPPGTTDPNPGNNTSTVTSGPAPESNLAIVKSVAPTYVPGQALTYTIVVTNAGLSNVIGARVQDALPAPFSGFQWTCSATGAAACGTSSGMSTIDVLVDIPVSDSVTFTATGTVPSSTVGPQTNTATVTPPIGVVDPNLGDNSSTVTTNATPQVDLGVVKSALPNPYVPGSPLTYAIVVTNAGPSDAVGAQFQDAVPAPLSGFAWTCAPSAGAACGTASGSGAINTLLGVPVGATVTFTVTGTVPSNTTGVQTNTATIAAPSGSTDTNPANNTSIVNLPGAPSADLSAIKTSSPNPYVPGSSLTYTITIANAGPSDAVGARVQDALPTELSGFTWLCTPGAGAACGTASGTGSIDVIVNMPVGSTVTFTASGIVPSSSTTPLTNTATVTPPPGTTDPNPGNNTTTITTPPGLSADLSIVKTASPDPYVPGATLTYNIVVSNLGPSDAVGATVQDTLPAPLSAFTWTCTAGAGAACGTASGTGNINAAVTVPAGQSVTFTVTGQVAPDLTGPLTNTATVTPPPGTTDPDPGNNTTTVTTDADPRADLAVSKSSALNPYVPGGPLTYTIVVSNLGPSTANGATVVDTFPAVFTGTSWTCTPNGGATCPGAGGSGPLPTAVVDLPPGGSTTFTVTGNVSSAATGQIINTAEVTPRPTVTDPVPGNNTAVDNNAANILADLRITKASTPNPFVPGDVLTYTIVVTNAGPSDVTGARVQDALPAAFAGFDWTCVPGAGAACGTATGTGDIDALVDLASGSSATFTSTGTVPANVTTAANNTATIMPPPGTTDPVPGNNTTTTSNPPGPVADLSIVKTLSPDPYLPGAPLLYRIVVSNAGPSDAALARVQDAMPMGLIGVTWSCQAGTGATCFTPNGAGDIDAMVTVPAGSNVTFTVSATAASGLTGVLNNTATVTPPATVTDPNPGNNTSTVTSGPAPEADLSVTKTSAPNPYVPGTPLTYNIVVRNDGPSDVTNARVQDAFPPAMSGFEWACVPSSGASCGSTNGVSTIDVLVNLTAGASVTFTATGVVPASATGAQSNTATVTPPIGTKDPDPTDNTSTTTTTGSPRADLSITKTSSPNPYVPGSPITYTVVISNAGPSASLGTRVRDIVPAVLQNVTWTCSAVGGTCSVPSGTGNIDVLVDITPGGTVTFEIQGDVPAGTRGSVVNTAVVLPPPGVVDPTASNNSAVSANPTVSLPTGPADLQITQEAPSVAPPNGLLTFRLVTKNLGSNTALNPYITGMIPPGTTFVSVTPSDGGTCNVPGNPPAPDPATGYPIAGAAAVEPLRCTWPGLMKPGESHTVEFTVRVAPSTPQGQILWSCFWTWSETEDPYHANNVVDAYLFVHDGVSPVGDLALQGATLTEGVIGAERPVRVGTPVPIRFWATNHGPAATRGQYALILDTANTVEIVSVKVAQGWISPSGPSSAVWETGPVQPGQTVAVDLTVRLRTSTSVKLFAQRIAGAPGDPNATNEHAEIVLDGYGPAGTAGRWVAVGNIDGAGAGEIITGAGQGETPQVRVFNGNGTDTGARFFAYERPFLGGVRVASCDVDGDGIAELITAPGPGRAVSIRVLRVAGGVVTEQMAFEPFEAGFLGGAYIACADLDADGAAELVIGAGPGRAPEVQVYNVGLATLVPRATFMAYESGFRGGVRVAAGVYPGRPGWLGAFAIATTPGAGRPAEVRFWEEAGAPVAQVVISSAKNGILPTLGDANGDGELDLVVAPDDGRPELIRIFEVDTGEVIGEVPGGLPAFPVGIRVALGVLQGGPGASEIVVGNGPGGHPRVRVVFWPPAGPAQRLEILPLEIP